jgi:predicted exporter
MPYLWRRRWFFLLLPMFLIVAFLNTRVETDLNAFFTAADGKDAALLASFLQSGELSRRYLITIEARSVANEKPPAQTDAETFAQAYAQTLTALPDVERAWASNRPPLEWITAIQGFAPHYARIYSLEPEAEQAELFDSSRLKAKAAGLKQALLSPQGGFIKQIAEYDPLLLSLQGFRQLQSRLSNLANKDTKTSGLIVQARAPALDTAAQTKLQILIRQRFDALNEAANQAYQLNMTGIPVFSVSAHDQINRDVWLVSTVSTVGVVLIFLLLFRSFAALQSVMLIVLASYASGALATSLVFGVTHSLTLALGSTLTGVCVDYPMHVLAHTSQRRDEHPDAAVRLVWPSLFIGALTTVVGYCALGLSGFPGFRQIAVFATASILVTLALTRWVLPALLTHADLRAPRIVGLDAWIRFCRRRRALLLTLLAVSLCAAGVLLPQIRWQDNLENMMMDMSALKQRDQDIRSHFTGIEPGRFVVVQGKDLETALQQSEAAERRLRKLKETGAVSEYYGLYPWLVSASLQQDNAIRYNQAVDEKFQSAWRAALRDAGLSVDKLALSTQTVTAMKPGFALSPEIRQILSGQIIEHPGGMALIIWLGDHDPAAVAKALEDLSGVRYFSHHDLLNGLARDYRDRSLVMLGWGLLLIYLMLWARYRQVKKAWFSLLPAMLATLFIFAAWAALGQEVSFLHVMCLLLAVSICEDYGIFFLDNGGQDVYATYQAIGASMLTTAVSFAALGLAENATLRTVSVAVTLGVVLGFLLCPLLIRAERTTTQPPFRASRGACKPHTQDKRQDRKQIDRI